MFRFFKSTISQKHSDDEIIIGIKKNGFKENVFIDYLYRYYLPLIIRFVKANHGTENEAKDIFQDGIIKFYKYVINEKFRQECSIKTYLYTICRRLWINELNRKGRKAIIDKDILEYINLKMEEDSPLKVLMKIEIQQTLQKLLSELSEACVNVLSLYYYQRKSLKEIASILKFKNEQTVATKKYKCIQSLKKHLKNNPNLKKHLREYLEQAPM